MGQTMRIFHPVQAKDGYGDLRATWRPAPDQTVRCRLQARLPRARVAHEGRNVHGERWLFFVEPGADLHLNDRVEVDADLFEVMGLYEVQHPKRGRHHWMIEAATVNQTVAYGG
jgi:hypothetical protein